MSTYNGARFLREQIDSVLGQTYRYIELVITDDGSTDGTIDIINDYVKGDTRVKLYQNPQNLGFVRNFEKAIYLCTGDYIALCDQDDIWEPDKLQQLVNNIGDNILIYHDSQLFNEEGLMVKVSDVFNMYEGDSPLALLFYNCLSGHAFMFDKKLATYLKQNGPFDPAFYHDWWIAFVAASYGSIKYLDKVLVQYRQHMNSKTDLIRIRGEMDNSGHPRYFHKSLPWLKKCYTVKGKYQQFIGKLIYLLEHKTWLNSFILLYHLLSKVSTTNYIDQKSAISKLNFLRKASFYKVPQVNSR
ncbi:glycosyltransferase family 2 protein [Mucilaginibacter ginkgonis]|uniref:Glycosyltransferase family 2 protein n=1 Tax=Mucilaginibacter ginkgonis TaxID=2682091 RepID=A0A7T7FA13_9SPHI|nr:glycosyltransferase family 2 protein [Mucilaginibacter ginkgonis]QQL49414.1 glycosyltransferase family 2 protein [Mucilaginibacter ginkgonis]